MLQNVLLVRPRGFCAGVVRAVDIVEEALKVTQPVYVRKEIVHNRFVVDSLRDKGAVFVSELEEIPDGTAQNPVVCVFSAHGVSPAVRQRAKEKHLFVIDATCPLVTKVHLEAIRYAKNGYDIVLIGHPGHEEVEGTMGEAPYAMHLVADLDDVEKLTLPQTDKIVFLTQTTLSVDDTRDIIAALKAKFPTLTQPPKEDICYATTNRQLAVKDLAPRCDLILVIGAQNSSNSQRLREVAEACGTRAFLIDDETCLRDEWFEGVQTVGISAGASAPEVLVERVIAALEARGAANVEALEVIPEDVFFPLPKNLREIPLMAA
ncbi:MAG TPA: 4-hydroxy-3-methylbut-2-enyl diphosphate reductase [Abditibacteriaceae bacterium]|jgi:4-hydroxy-3-methylbut-2-enyl diphosphate reductase